MECGITETCKVHLMVKKDADTRPKQPPKVKTYKPNEFWDLLEKMLSSQYDNEEVGIIMQQYRAVSCFSKFALLLIVFAQPIYSWWNSIDLVTIFSFFLLLLLTKQNEYCVAWYCYLPKMTD